MMRLDGGPWPDVNAAAIFLRGLVAGEAPPLSPTIDRQQLAAWVEARDLGPLTFARYGASEPALAVRLQGDYYRAAAENELLLSLLTEVLPALTAANIPVVVLKGAALASSVYADPALRPMSDVDLWVRAADMPHAAGVMGQLGFQAYLNQQRPLAWQMLNRGEIQFLRPGWQNGLVELHWSPFEGDWLRRTAAVDDEGVWARRQLLSVGGQATSQLSGEDMALHLALHLALGPKFGRPALRALVDLGMLARRGVDWSLVWQRARAWRVETVLWLVLRLARALVGVPDEELGRQGGGECRHRWLQTTVSPQSVLAGQELRGQWRGYWLLFGLVDRPQDRARLFWRTLWPERPWLDARYGPRASRLRHFWQAVRFGEL